MCGSPELYWIRLVSFEKLNGDRLVLKILRSNWLVLQGSWGYMLILSKAPLSHEHRGYFTWLKACQCVTHICSGISNWQKDLCLLHPVFCFDTWGARAPIRVLYKCQGPNLTIKSAWILYYIARTFKNLGKFISDSDPYMMSYLHLRMHCWQRSALYILMIFYIQLFQRLQEFESLKIFSSPAHPAALKNCGVVVMPYFGIA